jgi:hypothetical protein
MSRLKRVAKITWEEERQLMLARQVDQMKLDIEQLAIRADRLSEELADEDFKVKVVDVLYDMIYNSYNFNAVSDKIRDEVVDEDF